MAEPIIDPRKPYECNPDWEGEIVIKTGTS